MVQPGGYTAAAEGSFRQWNRVAAPKVLTFHRLHDEFTDNPLHQSSAGQEGNHQPNCAGRLLATAHGWQLQCDNVTTSSLRPRCGFNIGCEHASGANWAECPLGEPDWRSKRVGGAPNTPSSLQRAGAAAGRPAVNQLKLGVEVLRVLQSSEGWDSSL